MILTNQTPNDKMILINQTTRYVTGRVKEMRYAMFNKQLLPENALSLGRKTNSRFANTVTLCGSGDQGRGRFLFQGDRRMTLALDPYELSSFSRVAKQIHKVKSAPKALAAGSKPRG